MDKVVHFEIPFDDKARAMKFYSDCFGWQLNEIPEMDYVTASTVETDEQQMPTEPGAINGGMFQRPADAPNPTIYIGVDSISATLDRVSNAGGSVVTPETPIPGMGAYARVADSEGNVVGLFQA